MRKTVLDWRKSGLRADREAALLAAVEAAKIEPMGTSFEGKGTLNLQEFKKCAEKTLAIYTRRPW